MVMKDVTGSGARAALRLLAVAVACALPASGEVSTDLSKNGVSLTVTSDPDRVDVARDFVVTVKAVVPKGQTLALPDLRDRFVGFSVADDYDDVPKTNDCGSTTLVSNWRLVPKPCEKVYKLAPFVFGDFYTAPVYFDGPAAREPVTGGIEVDPKKDLPPLSWKLVRTCAIALLALAALIAGIWWTIRKILQKVREHRMSPIERAMLELDRLLKKGLPGRGRYKDFYVELTMVVRRYIQRQHGVCAPNLTTEEFFDAVRESPTFPKSVLDELIDFLRKADMVKFAGVEATVQTADSAAVSARTYMTKDDTVIKRKAESIRKRDLLMKQRMKPAYR